MDIGKKTIIILEKTEPQYNLLYIICTNLTCDNEIKLIVT